MLRISDYKFVDNYEQKILFLFKLMKTPIILLAVVLCTTAMFDASMYRNHIEAKNFVPLVKT